MSAATIIRDALRDGLHLSLTDQGNIKCTGPKPITERWTPQLRQHKAEIVAALNAANDPTPQADDFWVGLKARIEQCDALIHQLADLRGDSQEYREEMLATRKRMAPERLKGDIAYLLRATEACKEDDRFIKETKE